MLSDRQRLTEYAFRVIMASLINGDEQMEHNIDYDEDCDCFVWWLNGTGTCLFANNMDEAVAEVDGYEAAGKTPENMIIDEYNDDMDGDHDSAMASIGWGTDEDYGHFGGSDDY